MEKCFTPTVILLMLFLNEESDCTRGYRNEEINNDTHRLGLWGRGGGGNFIFGLI